MDIIEKQKTLVKHLADRKANKVTLFMIGNSIEVWKEADIDRLIDFASQSDKSLDNIVDLFLKLDKKYPHKDEKEESPKPVKEEPANKPFLFMFYYSGMEGLVKFQFGSDEVDYFSFSLWDFNVCRLPKDIYDDKELRACAKEWVYPTPWMKKKYKQLREMDFSKYEKVIVWNDMSPNSLMFLYTVCKFAKDCDIYENNVSKFNMNPTFSLNEPDRDYTGIFKGIRKISPELRNHFVEIYDRYAGKPMCPKIAKGYEIEEVSEDVIRERVLSHCSDEYKTAMRVVLECQWESTPQSQDFIGFNYYTLKVFEYTQKGMFDIKQVENPKFDKEDKPCMYNGVDISNERCYMIKRKSQG